MVKISLNLLLTSVSLKQDMFRYIAVFFIVGILLRSFFLYCDLTWPLIISMLLPRVHWGRSDRMVIGFTTTNQCLSPLKLGVRTPSWRGVLDTTLCDKVCQWLAAGRWFSSGTPISSTNKTDRHLIAEILLKVALDTIKHQHLIGCFFFFTYNSQNIWYLKTTLERKVQPLINSCDAGTGDAVKELNPHSYQHIFRWRIGDIPWLGLWGYNVNL